MRPWFLRLSLWNSLAVSLQAHTSSTHRTNHHRSTCAGRGNSPLVFNPGLVQFNKVEAGTERDHRKKFRRAKSRVIKTVQDTPSLLECLSRDRKTTRQYCEELVQDFHRSEIALGECRLELYAYDPTKEMALCQRAPSAFRTAPGSDAGNL